MSLILDCLCAPQLQQWEPPGPVPVSTASLQSQLHQPSLPSLQPSTSPCYSSRTVTHTHTHRHTHSPSVSRMSDLIQVHMLLVFVISDVLRGSFHSCVCVYVVVLFFFSGGERVAEATIGDVMLPHSCECEGVKGSFTGARWPGFWTWDSYYSICFGFQLWLLELA